MKRSTISERGLVLAPRGRDALLASTILREARVTADTCPSLPALIAELNAGAGFVVVTEEALATADLAPLRAWLVDQEDWSDMPFVLLTTGGAGLERNPAAQRFLELLGNVTFLERPFHPTTLVSLARAALRSRHRQYEARARLESLRASEERLRLVVDSAEDYAIITTDPERSVTSWSVGAEAIFGWKATEMMGRSADTIFTPEDRASRQPEAEIDTARSNGIAADERWHQRANGSRVFLRGSMRALPRDDLGRERGFIKIARDETDRRLAEARRVALLELSDRIRDVEDPTELSYAAAEILGRTLGVSRAGYGTIDKQAETIRIERDWNAPGIRSLAGVLRFRDYGSYIEDLKRGETVVFPDAEKDPRTAATAQALKAISAQSVVNMPVTEQGGFVALLYLNHATAREWTLDELELIREVAERTRTAVERRRAEREIRELATYLEQRVAERTAELMQAEEALRQAQKMEAVGQLTGGVAHDFNNLLTIIKSSTDLLRRPGLAEERRRRYVDAISDTVDRASKLTGQLLAFARRQALKPEVFDAADRVHAITDMLRTIVGSRIRIETEISCEDCLIEADASQFETALVNMAVNARDAMNGEGFLQIRIDEIAAMPPVRGHAGSPNPFVAVSLTDSGSGIPMDKLAHVFEPFFTTKEVGRGTGLGLSQVYGFAKQSGGDVAVESEVGRGTTFTLYLPRAAGGAASEKERPEININQVDTLTESDRGPRVLVVEDNIEVGQSSTQILADLGYDTTLATNAAEALKLLDEADRFDVVFSDVIMPGMNGVDLGREIRRRHPQVPVVLTSGYSEVLAEEGRHGFDLVQKPYAAEELSRVLRRVTRVKRIRDAR
ncbi:response regulator [Bradyrhizobium stylosanthis]|uniref:histidine kinase n=1 Tax=Bradyrhizobium stylosanthis TaxID=1803665 RepID=A0A560E2V3_9BRAD|nr:response regulator [Bradyrhizobium stylosanthis]TWB03603.1 PAS domain S-box-containing protein [Bradyrhizobium stylosanthis]